MIATILVIDLVGYSERLAWLEEQIPGSGATLNQQIESMVASAVQSARLRLEEALLKFTGDGAILKVADTDLAHRIAVSLQHASQAHNTEKKTELAKRIYRVGIATGEVTAYESASGSTDHGGTTIGRAARMEAGCKPGDVTVDEATWKALPGDLRSLYSGPEVLVDKNKAEFLAYRCQPGTAYSGVTAQSIGPMADAQRSKPLATRASLANPTSPANHAAKLDAKDHAMSNSPLMHHGVMISSTYVDVKHLRAVLMQAATAAGLFPRAMEHDQPAPNADVIDNSLKMVREASAYVLLIGHRYGQRPVCVHRNPNDLSICELEFEEALRLGRPIQLYLLSKAFPIGAEHVDKQAFDVASLEAFRKRAKSMDGNGGVNRIYKEVNSKRELEIAATSSMLTLKQSLDGGQVAPRHGPSAIVPATTSRAADVADRSADQDEVTSFLRAMQSLFDQAGPLFDWASSQGWTGGTPGSITSALSGADPVHTRTMPALFMSDVIAPMESDLASGELALSDARARVRKRLVDCMSTALSLSMEPGRRQQFLTTRDLRRVPAKTIVGMDLAVRKNALNNLERVAGGVGDAVRSKHSAQPMIETGEGRDRRWGILGHFASMVSQLNEEGQEVRIVSQADEDFWGGKFRAEGLLGHERLLVVSGLNGHDRMLSQSDIDWFARVGIRTVILEGDQAGAFWFIDEPLLVGITTSFLAFLDRCFK